MDDEILYPARATTVYCRDNNGSDSCVLYLNHYGDHKSNHLERSWPNTAKAVHDMHE